MWPTHAQPPLTKVVSSATRATLEPPCLTSIRRPPMRNANVPASSPGSPFEQQQLILETSGTGLWTWDIASDEVTWSPVCCSLMGADPDEKPLSFFTFLQRVHEDDRGPLQAAVNASLHGDGTFEHNFRVIHPDGRVRWLVNHGRVLYSSEGRPIKMLGSVQDITRHRSAEQRYADAQERLSLALESSGLGIWTWDVVSGQVSWSDECYRIHGLEKEQFAGTVEAFAALIHPEDRDRVFTAVQSAISARALYISEFRIVKPDGAVAWVSNRGRATYASDGSPVSVVGTIGDITRSRRPPRHCTLR